MSRRKRIVIIGSASVGAGVLIGLNSQTITGNSSGAWALAANGTNQSITLTPSGSGSVQIPQNSATSGLWIGGNSGDALRIGATSGGAVINFNGAQPISFQASGVATVKIGSTGNLLLGGLTTDGTGVLQLPAGTTSAGGLTLGDCNLYQSASAALTTNATLKAGGYLSSDGTVGLTQASTATLGKSITVKNGLITAFA